MNWWNYDDGIDRLRRLELSAISGTRALSDNDSRYGHDP